jgi:hypothetical protein
MTMLSQLEREAREAQEPQMSDLYPLSIWFLPGERSDVEQSIDLFRALPLDEDVFPLALSLGAMRLAVFDTFGDLLVDPAHGHTAVAWMRAAVQHARAIPVEWLVHPA